MSIRALGVLFGSAKIHRVGGKRAIQFSVCDWVKLGRGLKVTSASLGTLWLNPSIHLR